MPESSVLLTGASGFIGSALLQRLRESASTVEALSWREGPMLFQKSLAAGCKVVHLAGLAHAGKGRFSREDYLRVNTEYPVALAEQAIAAGAKRFIFVSSVKAAAYDPAQAFNNESCAGIPQDDYAYSKCLAEQRLQALDWGQCRLTIVRPALVIGPEVKGNMALLQKYAARWYFPMISGGGERSLLMLPDLLDLLIVLIERESSPSPCYIASSQHLSVGEQIAAIRKAAAVGKPHWRIPASLLRRMLSIIDRVTLRKLLLNEKADKMLSRECYSACLAEQELSWQPQQQLPAMLDGERVH